MVLEKRPLVACGKPAGHRFDLWWELLDDGIICFAGTSDLCIMASIVLSSHLTMTLSAQASKNAAAVSNGPPMPA